MNNQKYIYNFGLEIHIELLTKSKAFTPLPRKSDGIANSNLDEVILGYPGSKPTVNKKMIELAYQTAKLLKMRIRRIISFDRKNYFYPDLAKNYQITQFHHPLGINGIFEIIDSSGEYFPIKIKEIHIEEDTAKQIFENDLVKLDFNRAGNPLVEIVTEHQDFRNIGDICLFVEQLREMLKINEINSGVLADGGFRVDINFSMHEVNSPIPQEKIEIKNLNSIQNIRKALECEINLQTKKLEANEKKENCTKKFDEKLQQTVKMRDKNTKENYNFIPECNILPIQLNIHLLKTFNEKKLIFTNQIRKDFLKSKIPESQIKILLSDRNLFKIYQELSKINKQEDRELISVLTGSFLKPYKMQKTNYKKINIKQLSKIIDLFKKRKINNQEIISFFEKTLSKKDLSFEIKAAETKKFLSKTELSKNIKKMIFDNQEIIKKYQNQKQKSKQFLMGQLMKKSKGEFDPQTAQKIIDESLKQYDS